MTYIIRFSDESAEQHALVGGKGANLGRLTAAGFPVPGGFTVATDAYVAFVGTTGLQDEIDDILSALDHADADAVEAATADIRRRLMERDVPAEVADAIRGAYGELGDGAYVAVRSSGTAEDLADASFAGLHDTYLDIRGDVELFDAIKRCWASLWTGRATVYRKDKGFRHDEALLAVVVQLMVGAEVAGVMFTANPITGAVDETVVNAGWGLGEAVVSGIMTPDEYILDRETLKTKKRTLGQKAKRVVRDPSTGVGTIVEDVPAGDRERFTLSDVQVAELGDLGRRVQAYYDEFPQDTEWAYADGRFYLLQSRPVTGVDLSWDEDLEYWQFQDESPDTIYTRAWSDEYWNGAKTPLHYSYRAKELSDCQYTAQSLYGQHDLANMRTWRYYKGEAYFASDAEREWVARSVPPSLRNPGALNKLPPSWWQETLDRPFSWIGYAKIYARIKALDDRSAPLKFFKEFNDRIENRRDEANGLSNDELRRLSDRELHRHILDRLEIFKQADDDLWGAFFLYAPLSLGLLGDLLGRWYDGDAAWAFADLCSGLDEQTITLRENHELWALGQRLKASPDLLALMEEHPDGAAFFAALEDHEDGRSFLAEYRPWLQKRGHRGHADRDSWFPRRADDPQIDYNTFRALVSVESSDPVEQEHELREKRRAREEEVHASIRRGVGGALKLELFKLVHAYSLRFLAFRDNEREYLDNLTYTQRRCFLELGRRMQERGLVEAVDDVWFLGVEENFALLEGRAATSLCRAKITGRRKNFLRLLRKEVNLPNYLHPDGTVALPGELIGAVATPTDDDGSTVFPGAGTSQGKVTGRARVIRSLSDIGTLTEGDILICNSTDPGWTPVFLVISGLVLETGGMLSHGACLSREYGLPAVAVPEAMSRIPDGATITVDGDTGIVKVVEDGADEAPTPELQPAVVEG